MATVLLGNRFPAHVRPEDRRGDHVTEIGVPDEFTDDYGNVLWDVPKEFDHKKVRSHLEKACSPYRMDQVGITRMVDHAGQGCAALLTIFHPLYGAVTPFQHGHFGPGADGNASKPTWVWSDNSLLAKHVSEWYQCPVLDDKGLHDIEDTHTTKFGPPGVVPGAVLDFNGLFTNVGRVAFNNMMGGGPQAAGATGQLTASSGTTATTTFTTTSTTQFTGYRMYATVSASSMVWGNIISCTNGSNAVFTVDRWYNPASPGGSAGSTPSSTGTWMIPDGGTQSFWFMGVTQNSSAPAATDTSLTAEITTAGAGFIRQVCAFHQTSGVANTQYTLTAIYQANGNDLLPYNSSGIAKIGIFNSMVVSDTTQTMMWETLYGAAAPINSSGDQLTSVDTITGS